MSTSRDGDYSALGGAEYKDGDQSVTQAYVVADEVTLSRSDEIFVRQAVNVTDFEYLFEDEGAREHEASTVPMLLAKTIKEVHGLANMNTARYFLASNPGMITLPELRRESLSNYDTAKKLNLLSRELKAEEFLLYCAGILLGRFTNNSIALGAVYAVSGFGVLKTLWHTYDANKKFEKGLIDRREYGVTTGTLIQVDNVDLHIKAYSRNINLLRALSLSVGLSWGILNLNYNPVSLASGCGLAVFSLEAAILFFKFKLSQAYQPVTAAIEGANVYRGDAYVRDLVQKAKAEERNSSRAPKTFMILSFAGVLATQITGASMFLKWSALYFAVNASPLGLSSLSEKTDVVSTTSAHSAAVDGVFFRQHGPFLGGVGPFDHDTIMHAFGAFAVGFVAAACEYVHDNPNGIDPTFFVSWILVGLLAMAKVHQSACTKALNGEQSGVLQLPPALTSGREDHELNMEHGGGGLDGALTRPSAPQKSMTNP